MSDGLPPGNFALKYPARDFDNKRQASPRSSISHTLLRTYELEAGILNGLSLDNNGYLSVGKAKPEYDFGKQEPPEHFTP